MKLGDTLKQARESKELTVQAVADAIHLSVKQITALETNNFNLLPEPVTTRGFIRSYARFLEIDSEPLLANYRELVPHQDPNTIVMSGQVNKVISAQEQSPWLMYILGSIIVLLLLVVWFYYMDNVNDWSVGPDSDIALEAPVDSAGQTALVQEELPAQSTAEPQVDAAVEATAGEIAVTEEAVKPVEQSIGLEVAGATQTITEPLIVRLKEDCWVSIKTMSGQKFFEKLLPAGTEQGFDIQPPFKLKIGNATAATVSYRDQRLDLPKYTRGSVARLTVNDVMLAKIKQAASEVINADEAAERQTESLESAINPELALVIKTQEACWVSVKNVAGKTVFEKLLPAASNQVIEVSKPFRLTVGNASAAQASYNNQALDLESNKQHNVAKLRVE